MGLTISVTERLEYMRCRRLWDYSSWNRMHLEPIKPAPALYIGSAVHHALAADVAGLDPLEQLDHYCDRAEQKYEEEYKKFAGSKPEAGERMMFSEGRHMARSMIEHYFEFYLPELLPQGYEYIAAEITFRVPIPGTDGFLAGTVDAIASHGKKKPEVWLVERKTYAQQPNENDLARDDQQLGYLWAAQQMLGMELAGVLYDGLGKRIPTAPKNLLLQSGLPTTAKDKLPLTTPDNYHAACQLNEAAGDITQFEKYAEALAQVELAYQGPVNRFFSRYKFRRSQAEVASFGRHLPQLYNDMVRSIEEDRLYPNFRWEGCWDCSFQTLCDAEEQDEDFNYLVENSYRQSPGYGTTWALDGEKVTLTGIDEVRKFYNSIKLKPFQL